MADLKLTIATEPRPLPSSVPFGGFKFTLKRVASGNEVTTDPVLESTYIFPNAAPGEYTASVVAVDANGTQLGEGVAISVVVPEVGVTMYDHPTGLSYEIL